MILRRTDLSRSVKLAEYRPSILPAAGKFRRLPLRTISLSGVSRNLSWDELLEQPRLVAPRHKRKT